MRYRTRKSAHMHYSSMSLHVHARCVLDQAAALKLRTKQSGLVSAAKSERTWMPQCAGVLVLLKSRYDMCVHWRVFKWGLIRAGAQPAPAPTQTGKARHLGPDPAPSPPLLCRAGAPALRGAGRHHTAKPIAPRNASSPRFIRFIIHMCIKCYFG